MIKILNILKKSDHNTDSFDKILGNKKIMENKICKFTQGKFHQAKILTLVGFFQKYFNR